MWVLYLKIGVGIIIWTHGLWYLIGIEIKLIYCHTFTSTVDSMWKIHYNSTRRLFQYFLDSYLFISKIWVYLSFIIFGGTQLFWLCKERSFRWGFSKLLYIILLYALSVSEMCIYLSIIIMNGVLFCYRNKYKHNSVLIAFIHK